MKHNEQLSSFKFGKEACPTKKNDSCPPKIFLEKKARRKQLAKIYKRLFFRGIIPDPLKQYVNT